MKLPKKCIDIWVARPTQIKGCNLVSEYLKILTDQEIEQIQRFSSETQRHTALITRVFIRVLLSKYLGITPESVFFRTGCKGKPEISKIQTPIRFNLSHTYDFIVCAVTLVNDIGVDVEYTQREIQIDNFSKHFFCDSERARLLTLPLMQRRETFFELWTLKESYLKACGEGVGEALSHFTFNLEDKAHIEIIFNSMRKDDPKNWQSWLFSGSPSHRIAVSIRSPKTEEYQIRQFQMVPLENVWAINLPLPY
ncbi:4'-phosphopantetheinyl transferase family protein [Vibrio sp. TRT 2004]|uniref:4'-phosphopantetheinyl transferase family protein n=1 Tax=Vibrio sp. TRT 2004 TaxID=3418506 RepID=UPI003CEC49F3